MMSLIFGAATIITAGAGVVLGADGVSKLDEAKKIEQDAHKRYEQKRESVARLFHATQELAKEYGQLQIQAHFQTIERFVAFIDRLDRAPIHNASELLAGVDRVSPQQIQQYQALSLELKPIATSCLTAVTVGDTADWVQLTPMRFLAKAGTRTAFGGSIEATTLGWLGGGSLAAAGGTGMAFGSAILGGFIAAPVLAIGGSILGRSGEKSLVESSRYEESVNAEIAKINAFEDFLGHVQRRIIELKQLVTNLNDRAIQSLTAIESRNFSYERDAEKLQQVTLLIKTLAEVMKTPVVEANAAVPQQRATAPLNAKYLLFSKSKIANGELLTASC
jgi:hypothetical protein